MWHLCSAAWTFHNRTRCLHETASALLLLRECSVNKDGGIILSPHEPVQIEESTSTHSADVELNSIERRPTLRRTDNSVSGGPAPQVIISKKDLGGNALAHGERRIDPFTALTELFVFIKLLSVTGLPWFTAAAMCMVCGWAAVHLLLILLHVRQLDEDAMRSITQETIRFHGSLQRHANHWIAFFMVLHTPAFGYPAFGYPAYLGAFRPWLPKHATGFVSFLKAVADFVATALSAIIARLSFFIGLFGLFWLPRNLSRRLIAPFLLGYIPAWIWLTTTSLSYLAQQNIPGDGLQPEQSNFTSFFEPQTVMYYVVDQGFVYAGDAIWFLVFLLPMVFIYWIVFYAYGNIAGYEKSRVMARRMVSVGNFIFTIVIFSIYIASYNPVGTQKPDWTDILG